MTAIKPFSNKTYDLGSSNIKEAISKKLAEFTREELFIGLPARVVRVDQYEERQVVDVELIVEDQWVDGRVLSAAVLKSIFVKIPSGGGFSIKLPIAIGDLVTLHWTHRSISDWLDGDGGNIQQPVDYTALLRDCYVQHGFGTRKNHQSPSQTDLVISSPNASITITPAGKVTISADVGVTVSGDLTVNGAITAPTIEATTTLKVGTLDVGTHGHATAPTGPVSPPIPI